MNTNRDYHTTGTYEIFRAGVYLEAKLQVKNRLGFGGLGQILVCFFSPSPHLVRLALATFMG